MSFTVPCFFPFFPLSLGIPPKGSFFLLQRKGWKECFYLFKNLTSDRLFYSTHSSLLAAQGMYF
jgi:hypothetical protein